MISRFIFEKIFLRLSLGFLPSSVTRKKTRANDAVIARVCSREARSVQKREPTRFPLSYLFVLSTFPPLEPLSRSRLRANKMRSARSLLAKPSLHLHARAARGARLRGREDIALMNLSRILYYHYYYDASGREENGRGVHERDR